MKPATALIVAYTDQVSGVGFIVSPIFKPAKHPNNIGKGFGSPLRNCTTASFSVRITISRRISSCRGKVHSPDNARPQAMTCLTGNMFQNTTDQAQVRGGKRQSESRHRFENIFLRFGKFPQSKISLAQFSMQLSKKERTHFVRSVKSSTSVKNSMASALAKLFKDWFPAFSRNSTRFIHDDQVSSGSGCVAACCQ